MSGVAELEGNIHLRWVGQKGLLDCTRAACAMLFDLDYDDAPITPPVQHTPGTQEHAAEVDKFMEEFRGLSAKSGYEFREIRPTEDPSCGPKPGYRYLAVVARPDPSILHCIVIDEHGTILDPDPAPPVPCDLSSYKVLLFIELYKVSSPASHTAANVLMRPDT